MIDYARHETVFHPVTWGKKRVDVVGVGATGSHIALALAKLGVQNLHVWDDDKVESHNLANQAYDMADIGQPKTKAIARHIHDATETKVTQHGRWDRRAGRTMGEVVFVMVDSMAVRSEMFRAYGRHPTVRLLIDSRMGATHGQLLTYRPGSAASLKNYESMLFSDDDAHVEVSACGTAITVGPTAQIISGYALWSFIRYAAGGAEAIEPAIAIGAEEPMLVPM